MLNFRTWFESWIEELPGGLPVNESEVRAFVEAMADNSKNLPAKRIAEASPLFSRVNEDRYKKPLSDNLLTISSPKLKYAQGTVTDRATPKFAFYLFDGEYKAGNLVIRIPPVLFDDEDKVLLRRILKHELRHAVDWLNPEIQDEPSGKYVREGYIFNLEKYTTNRYEARAHAEELRDLMKQIGDVNKVLQLLQKRSEFSMSKQLIGIAEEFLHAYQLRHEQITTTPPPAIVRPAMMYEGRAAQLLGRMLTKMLFRNFVEKA